MSLFLIAFATLLIGLFCSAFLLWAWLKFSKGKLERLIKTLFLTIFLTLFPLTIYLYLLSANVIKTYDSALREGPIVLFLFLFFAGMLYATNQIMILARDFGFSIKADNIKHAIKKIEKK